MAKTALSPTASMTVAVKVPKATPTATAGPQLRSRSQSTEPRLWCERVDIAAVATMVDSEVPIARCIRTASGTPIVPNRWNRTGTMTMPPPIPSMPAIRPAAAPAVSRAATMAATVIGS